MTKRELETLEKLQAKQRAETAELRKRDRAYRARVKKDFGFSVEELKLKLATPQNGVREIKVDDAWRKILEKYGIDANDKMQLDAFTKHLFSDTQINYFRHNVMHWE